MNLPSTQFSMDVAKIGDKLIVSWFTIPPTGGAGAERGEVVLKHGELQNWLWLAAERFIQYR
jgi:hypothetical protein